MSKISSGRYQSDDEQRKALENWYRVLQPLDIKGETTMPLPEEVEKRMHEISASQNMKLIKEQKQKPTERLEMPDDYNPFQSDYHPHDYQEQGMIVPDEEDEIFIRMPEEPEYLRKLRALDIDDEDKLALLSLIESQPNAVTFKSLAIKNKEVEIYGGAIWFHPPFKKNLKDANGNSIDSPLQPGYEQIVWIAKDGDGEIYTIIAAHGRLAAHAHAILDMRGWFIWKEPVKYTLSLDEKNTFKMINQDRVNRLLNYKTKKAEK